MGNAGQITDNSQLRNRNHQGLSINLKGALELQATYKAMIEALLQINRTDLAENIIAIFVTVRSAETETENDKRNENIYRVRQTNMVVPPSLLSSMESEDAHALGNQSPTAPVTSVTQNEQAILALRELEEEFYDFVISAEVALKKNKVYLDTITRRFSMLPQSI